MKIFRTEQIWIKPNKNISRLCHLSKNLFNQGNYIIKETLDKEGKWIHYEGLDKILNGKSLEPSENYKQLPASTAQSILMLLDKNWTSFFKSIREWKIHPEKF